MARRRRNAPPPPDLLDPEMAAILAAALAPADLQAADQEALHRAILTRIRDEPPAGTVTNRAAGMNWIAVGPGVEVKILRIDRERNDQTVLIRMQSNAVVLGHCHTREEECLILEGDVFIGNYRLGEGDMHVAKPGARHAAIKAPRGALLLIRSEIPPQNFRIA